jgi:hypothetical protein
VPLPASLGATSAAGDMSDIRPDILEMIKEEQKVSTQHHGDMVVANRACSSLYAICTYIPHAHALCIHAKDIRRAEQKKVVFVLPLEGLASL